MNTKLNQRIFLVLIGLATLSSCKKKEADPIPAFKAPDSSFGLIHDKILVTSCALSGCHADESHADHGHTLTLKGAGVYDALINAAVKNSQAKEAGLLMVAPGDTTKSWLYQKMTYNRSKHKYGAPMPLGGLKVTNNQVQFIRQWIQAGAPKEGHVVDKALIQ